MAILVLVCGLPKTVVFKPLLGDTQLFHVFDLLRASTSGSTCQLIIKTSINLLRTTTANCETSGGPPRRGLKPTGLRYLLYCGGCLQICIVQSNRLLLSRDTDEEQSIAP